MDTTKINALWQELRSVVMTYESDTFSASGSKLTEKEADQITNILAQRALMSMIDLDTLDGAEISEVMDDYVRPEADDFA